MQSTCVNLHSLNHLKTDRILFVDLILIFSTINPNVPPPEAHPVHSVGLHLWITGFLPDQQQQVRAGDQLILDTNHQYQSVFSLHFLFPV